MAPGAKRCYACNRLRSSDDFPLDRSKRIGVKSICRECDNEKSRRYYAENRERVLERMGYPPSLVKRCGDCGVDLRARKFTYCVPCGQKRKRLHKHAPGWRKSAEKLRVDKLRYGPGHRKLRAAWKVRVAAGGVRCARCLEEILPSQPWDLGHVDGSDVRYAGPEHRSCNRATGSRDRSRRGSRSW